ncbi:MAG: SDR family NAD(P)-dependent oxidoreductase [Chloroflexi bacterium]|nr:SDR family NAD(P)-dependent oxidoreductase [Chloroflexota bacterium]
MPNSLENKIVLITGASSGFGEHAAHLFAREGCKVVLAARRLERLQALAEEIQSAGGEALIVPVDVAQRAEIELMVQTVLDVYGQIDILFNNAGFGRLDWFENLDPGRDIETQIDVNLLGLIQVTRAVLPHMIARRTGHIINMSSVAGWLAAPLYSVYAATKFGVRGFTEALRREVRHMGIHVSGIYPGGAATEFSLHTGDNSIKRSFKTPAGLRMTAEFVAEQVVRIAKRPRRTLIIPWWMRPVIWLNSHFPATADWFQMHFARKYHNV